MGCQALKFFEENKLSRKKIIAGNWKMFKGISETKDFLASISSKISHLPQLVLFTQSPLLSVLQSHWKGGDSLAWGPQNIHWEEKGAFTGELSPLLAKELGCTFALSGHSERRQFFGETNESAAKRALAAHKHGLNAMLCVGETLAERDGGKTFSVLQSQLASLFSLSSSPLEGLSVAYEPVWAIGTGRNASASQAQEAHLYIRGEFAKAWGEKAAQSLPILYGGSVKPENSAELLGQKDVDGALIGGASLEPASFLAIAAAAIQ